MLPLDEHFPSASGVPTTHARTYTMPFPNTWTSRLGSVLDMVGPAISSRQRQQAHLWMCQTLSYRPLLQK